MNLDTLEIFEVIDLDEEKEAAVTDTEELPEEVKTSPYDELGRIWLGNGYYYKPSSIIYQVIKDDVIHQLSPRKAWHISLLQTSPRWDMGSRLSIDPRRSLVANLRS